MDKQRISSAAHPMACFSEFSCRELEQATITYGKYGIAFTKDWASNKKLSPVIYIENHSQAAKGLGALLRARQNKLHSKLPDHLRLPIMQLKCFTKNVRGHNSYFNEDDFDFKSENEWRYVPSKKDIKGNLISQHLSKYLDDPAKYNKKLEPYPLRFNTADIEKIFVSCRAEIKSFSKELKINERKFEISVWKTKK